MTSHLPKAPLLTPSHWGLGVNIWVWGDGNIYSVLTALDTVRPLWEDRTRSFSRMGRAGTYLQDPSVTRGGPGPPSRAAPKAPRRCIASITLASHLEDAVDVWVFAILQPPTSSPVPTAASRATFPLSPPTHALGSPSQNPTQGTGIPAPESCSRTQAP